MTARVRRPGYTLFEVLLVCAILVILVSITIPSIRGMYPYFKMKGAVDSVRAAFAQARGRAILENRPYRFSVENHGSHYRVAPDRAEYWSGSSPSDDPDGKPLILEDALPGGVKFILNGDPSSTASLEEPPTATKEPARSGLSPDAYTTGTVFQGDGTARDDVRIVFQIKGTRPVAVKLRGLTGTVSVETLQ